MKPAVASELVLGTAELVSGRSRLSLSDARRVLLGAYELGVTGFDTAPIYAQGFAERLLGQTVSRRPDVLIITKVGRVPTVLGAVAYRSVLPLRRRMQVSQDSAGTKKRPQESQDLGIRRASHFVRSTTRRALIGVDFGFRAVDMSIRASSRRLRVDTLDVVVLHSPTQRSQLWKGLESLSKLVERGDIRELGVAVADAPQLMKLHEAFELAEAKDVLRHLLVPSWVVASHRKELSALRMQGRRLYATQAFSTYDEATHTRGTHLRSLLSSGVDHVIVGTTRLDHLDENLSG